LTLYLTEQKNSQAKDIVAYCGETLQTFATVFNGDIIMELTYYGADP
jgi:hypothetical protein